MVRKVLAEFDAVDGPFLQKLSRIDAGIARFEKGALTGFGRVEKGVNGLLASASRLNAIGGAFAGAFGAQMAANFLDQATQIRNGLAGIGQDSQENFDKLYLAATRSRAGMETFAASVMRFQKVMGDRQSLDTTIRQVETLNKLMLLSGKSAGERGSVVTQFTQALQSGVLQGDELRSLRENAPVEFLQALSSELGGTVADLKAFGEQGRITTDVMVAALTKLEAEADARMASIQMTFADAATVLGNGALKAAAEFDQGLGVTRAGTATLQALGQLLGDNAEAFETFGQAVKLFAIAIGGAYLGRNVQAAQASLLRFYATQTAGVQAAYASAVKAQAAEALVVAAKQKTVLALRAKVMAMAAEGAAEAKVTALQGRLATAETALTAARGRFTAATIAATAANERLAISARAVAAAGTLVRGAWAFIGGLPGLVLILGTAFLTMGSNAETAADRMAKLREATSNAKTAADNLIGVQDRLNATLEQSGRLGTEAGRQIVAATLEELRVKRDLLAFETERLQAAQAARLAELNDAQARAAQLEDTIAALSNLSPGNRGGVVIATQLANAKAELEALRGTILQMRSDTIDAQNAINANNDLLVKSGAMLVEKLADAALQSGMLSDWLASAEARMDAIANKKIDGPIAAAARMAASLFGYLSAAANVRPGNPGSGPSFESGGRNGSSAGPIAPPSVPTLDEMIANAGSGGGGGGGGSSRNADLEEALRLVEQMMTTEERRAKEMASMIALRDRLIQTYGPEAEIVGQMDEAIRRAQTDMTGLSSQMDEFWGTLSDHVSQSIDEWKGWGNFLRSLFADLARKWGPDFFEALFTPGQQAGGGFGQVLGNLVTGGLFGAAPAAMPSRGLALPAPVQAGGQAVNIVQHNDFRGADPSMKAEIMAQLERQRRELPGKVIETIREAKRARIPL